MEEIPPMSEKRIKPNARIITFALGMICLIAFMANASPPGIKKVNQERIKALYQAGDLDSVQQQLQGCLQSRATLSKGDSIFVFKYLSVAMAADETTLKSLTKDCMYKLFTLAPEVDIIDLFVSQDIYKLFTEVKEEFNARQLYLYRQKDIEKIPSQQIPDTASRPSKRREAEVRGRETNRNLWYFALGGIALAGAATGFYYWNQESGSPSRKTLSN